MFCRKCGNEVKPGVKFCSKCGTPVTTVEQMQAAQPKTEQPRAVQPNMGQPQSEKSGKGLKVAIIIIIVVVVLAAGGVGGYFLWDYFSENSEISENDKDDEDRKNDNDRKDDNDVELNDEEQNEEMGEEQVEEPEEEPLQIVVDPAQVQAAVDAYLVYVLENGMYESGYSYALLNIDGDCVPELLCDSGYTAGGLQLLSYYNGIVHENRLEMGGFYYVEYRNRIYLSSGRMGYYSDVIYHLQSGTLVEDISGSWYEEMQGDNEEGYEVLYEYAWNNKNVSEEEYNKKLAHAFDMSKQTSWSTSDSLDLALSKYITGVPELAGMTLSDVTTDNGDVLPTSSSEYLTKAEIQQLTDEELRIARNEIYARHGYTFKDEALLAYFMSKPWYQPTVAEVPDSVMNEYELANRTLILEVEEERQH